MGWFSFGKEKPASLSRYQELHAEIEKLKSEIAGLNLQLAGAKRNLAEACKPRPAAANPVPAKPSRDKAAMTYMRSHPGILLASPLDANGRPTWIFAGSRGRGPASAILKAKRASVRNRE